MPIVTSFLRPQTHQCLWLDTADERGRIREVAGQADLILSFTPISIASQEWKTLPLAVRSKLTPFGSQHIELLQLLTETHGIPNASLIYCPNRSIAQAFLAGLLTAGKCADIPIGATPDVITQHVWLTRYIRAAFTKTRCPKGLGTPIRVRNANAGVPAPWTPDRVQLRPPGANRWT